MHIARDANLPAPATSAEQALPPAAPHRGPLVPERSDFIEGDTPAPNPE